MTSESLVEIGDACGLALSTDAIIWLATGKAAEFRHDRSALEVMTPLRQQANELGIDVNLVPTKARRKKMMIADMDSTIITDESLDEMARLAGLGPAVAAITARSMNGELDFGSALDERVAMLAGQPAGLFDTILAATQLTAGARTLVQTMRANAAYCYLVSGGFRPIAEPVAQMCGFDAAHANEMTFQAGLISGTVKKPILGRNAKAEIMAAYCDTHGIAPTDVATIGDGANDLVMLQAAGMGVAFNGKPILREKVALQLNHTDLTGLLYLQGYKEAEFVT